MSFGDITQKVVQVKKNRITKLHIREAKKKNEKKPVYEIFKHYF
jgi:predicted ribosome quality control (RQC) complex YloA/Tae2 family protein